MKLRHPLHEFMPYGAPDLLVAHRPDLSRALTVAATAAFSLFVLMAAWSGLAPHAVVKHEVEMIVDRLPPMRLEPQRPAASSSTPRARVHADPRIGEIRPVEHETPKQPVIPDWLDGLKDQVQDKTGTGPVAPPVVSGFPPAVEEDLDKPATYAEVWPVAITEVKPEYPQIARDAMVDGKVIVLVLVGRDGHVREAKLDEHHHVLLLDEAALAAARKWVFSPALASGHPVAVWTAIPFDFILQ